MFDYHLCNLNVAPSRRNVKRSSVNTTNSVYMLWILVYHDAPQSVPMPGLQNTVFYRVSLNGLALFAPMKSALRPRLGRVIRSHIIAIPSTTGGKRHRQLCGGASGGCDNCVRKAAPAPTFAHPLSAADGPAPVPDSVTEASTSTHPLSAADGPAPVTDSISEACSQHSSATDRPVPVHDSTAEESTTPHYTTVTLDMLGKDPLPESDKFATVKKLRRGTVETRMTNPGGFLKNFSIRGVDGR
ncbi:hypothetical protein V8E52_003596 [Russula decolorans]